MFGLKRRINRITYLVGLISIPILIFVGQVILGTILGLVPGIQTSLNKSKPDTLVNVTGTVAMLIYFPFLLAVTIYFLLLIKQRSNDITNRSLALSFVALISILGVLILAIVKGKKQGNKFGAPQSDGVHLLR